MTDLRKEALGEAEDHGAGAAALLETLKTAGRLASRQINDEIALAKLDLEHKKTHAGATAVSAGIALVFSALLVIALVVAAIAGLGTVVPLWLSALIVCGALLIIIAIAGLVAYTKFKKLRPLVPEHASRGIRHDIGIVKLGPDFDPATLDPTPANKEEKKARKLAAAEAKARAAAERAVKEAQQGPKATEAELLTRTAARRKHLLTLRQEVLSEADVKKLSGHAFDAVRQKTRATVNQAASQRAEKIVEGARERWKPLAVLAVSASVLAVLLRKLMKK